MFLTGLIIVELAKELSPLTTNIHYATLLTKHFFYQD